MTTLPSERRNFYRMSLDTDMEYRSPGSAQTVVGRCKDLSAEGAMFTTQHQVESGTLLDIRIIPDLSITGPLDALFQVTRITTLDASNYEVAGVIKEIRSS